VFNSNDVKIVLTTYGAQWIIVNSLELLPSLDKQRLPQKLDKGYWTRSSLSNRRLGWLCQSIRHLWPSLPSLRGSATRKACTLKVIQLTQIRKIETGSNISFCSLSTTKTMVSVKSLSYGWLSGGRGHVVLQPLGRWLQSNMRIILRIVSMEFDDLILNLEMYSNIRVKEFYLIFGIEIFRILIL
jgi:hypothetical protein